MGKFDSVLSGALKGLEANNQSIRDRITINPKFRDFIPPLSNEELKQLEENILKEGVRDPIIVWSKNQEYTIVDGHNRFNICQTHGLNFSIKQLEFKDDDEVLEWMAKNQLGRRNLTPEQISYFRGKRYLQERGKVGDNKKGHNDPSQIVNTSEKLANEYSVSPKTIKRDASFAKGLDLIGEQNPDIRNEILQSKSSVSKKDVEQISKHPHMLQHIITKKGSSEVERKADTSLSNSRIPAIALQYIQEESRELSEVIRSLNLEIESIDPISFFRAWHNSRR